MGTCCTVTGPTCRASSSPCGTCTARSPQWGSRGASRSPPRMPLLRACDTAGPQGAVALKLAAPRRRRGGLLVLAAAHPGLPGRGSRRTRVRMASRCRDTPSPSPSSTSVTGCIACRWHCSRSAPRCLPLSFLVDFALHIARIWWDNIRLVREPVSNWKGGSFSGRPLQV